MDPGGLVRLLDIPPYQLVLMLRILQPGPPDRTNAGGALRRLALAMWRSLQGALEITIRLECAQDEFVIFDLCDDTYRAGDGSWTDDPEKAMRYESEEAAQAGIEVMDCASLRNRLVVRSADLA